VHSIYSHDNISQPPNIIREALNKRLDGIVVTEHHSIGDMRRWERHLDPRLMVLMGIEHDSSDGHVLLYGTKHRDLYSHYGFVSGPDMSELVAEEEGTAIVAAHPYAPWNGIGDDVFRGRFHALEVNSSMSDEANMETIHAAKRMGLPLTGGSDAHSEMRVGNAYTVFENEIRNIDDLVRELRTGRYYPEFYNEEKNKWLQSLLQ
ncbi:PHP-associated domain-containing protein, partial [Thermodesulfobacteriota bacterium]